MTVARMPRGTATAGEFCESAHISTDAEEIFGPLQRECGCLMEALVARSATGYSRMPTPRYISVIATANNPIARLTMIPSATGTDTSLTPRKP